MFADEDATGHPGQAEADTPVTSEVTPTTAPPVTIERQPLIEPDAVRREYASILSTADARGNIWPLANTPPTDGENAAYQQGYVDGVRAGHEVGQREGGDEGYHEGRKEGYRAGYNDRGNDQARLDGLAREVLDSAVRCHRHDAPKGACVELATVRYTWPGQSEESFACVEHAESIREVATAIGLELELTPL